MATVAIIFSALLGTIAVCVGLVKLVDLLAKRGDEKDVQTPAVEIDKAAGALHLASAKVLQISLGNYSGVREKPKFRVPEMTLAEA